MSVSSDIDKALKIVRALREKRGLTFFPEETQESAAIFGIGLGWIIICYFIFPDAFLGYSVILSLLYVFLLGLFGSVKKNNVQITLPFFIIFTALDLLGFTSIKVFVRRYTFAEYKISMYRNGPTALNYKVELWWDSTGAQYLEDVRFFSIQVVKLFVSPWGSSPLFVENGKTINSTWSINMGNGGNDIMYDTSVFIVDSGGLQISPTSADLGDIASKETKLAIFNVTAPNTLSTGSKNVSFLISYKDFRGASHIESKILYVIVKLGTSIELTLSSSSVKKEDSILITAKLLDGNGKPIYDEPIDFFVGTESLGLVRTDSSGAANKSCTANVDAGSYTIVTSYAGNNTLLPTSASSDFIVNKLDTALVVNIPSATQGRECVLKAVLSDERDRLLQGIDVDFYFYESDSWKKIGSGVTNVNGTASLNYTSSSTGTFQVKAIFNGTLNYSQSFSPASNMTVAVDYTIYLIGGVIIATVIIIVYLILRRKSTPQS